VSIVVLRVMTLTIVTHYIHNSIPTNLPTIKMVKENKDMGEIMVPKARAK
jgi:hypothetical protein